MDFLNWRRIAILFAAFFAIGTAETASALRGGDIILGATGAGESGGCTGSLIGPRTYLTAAHCVVRTATPTTTSGMRDFTIYYHKPGVGRLEVYSESANWFAHPTFDMSTSGFSFTNADIAIVQIQSRFDAPNHGVDYRDYLRIYADDKINLRYSDFSPPLNRFAPPQNQWLTVYGAGIYTYSGKTDSKIRTQKFEVESVEKNHIVIDTRRRVGICKGDSGGPIIFSKPFEDIEVPLIAGVSSWIEFSGSEPDTCVNNDFGIDDAYYSRTNWEKLSVVLQAAGVRCEVLEIDGISYRRCFDIPFINDVPFEGLERSRAVSIVSAAAF